MNIGLQMFRAQNRFLSLISPEQAISKAAELFFTPKRHQPKSWEQQAESTGRRVSISPGVSAIVWGTGKPVLLMHGWEGRATQMAGFIEPLLSSGFQLIALDAPAHGLSDGIRSNPLKFIEAIFNAEKVFGSFYAVIGHSMGGGCALYAASQGLSADKIVSISGPASFKRVSRRFANFIGLSKQAISGFIEHAEKEVGIPFAQIDLVSQVPAIRQPVLLVHDNQDKEIPFGDARLLAGSMLNARLYVTEGFGHRKIMRAPIMIDTVSDFIKHEGFQFLSEAL